MVYKFSSIISTELCLTSTVFRGIKYLCEFFSLGKNKSKWQVRIFGLKEETNQDRKHSLVDSFMTQYNKQCCSSTAGDLSQCPSARHYYFIMTSCKPSVILTFSACSSCKHMLHDARVLFCFQRELIFTVSPSTLSSSKGLCWLAMQKHHLHTEKARCQIRVGSLLLSSGYCSKGRITFYS